MSKQNKEAQTAWLREKIGCSIGCSMIKHKVSFACSWLLKEQADDQAIKLYIEGFIMVALLVQYTAQGVMSKQKTF